MIETENGKPFFFFSLLMYVHIKIGDLKERKLKTGWEGNGHVIDKTQHFTEDDTLSTATVTNGGCY